MIGLILAWLCSVKLSWSWVSGIGGTYRRRLERRRRRERDEIPSLKHPVRTGKKKSGAKKKKSWDSVVKGAQGKGVKNPKAYAAKVFRAQGIDPRTGKKTKKKK